MKISVIILSLFLSIGAFAKNNELDQFVYQNDPHGKLNVLAEEYSQGANLEILFVSSSLIGHSNLAIIYGRHGEIEKQSYNSWAIKNLLPKQNVIVTFLTLPEQELIKMGFKAAPGLIFFKEGRYVGHKVGHVYPQKKIASYFLEFLENPMSLQL